MLHLKERDSTGLYVLGCLFRLAESAVVMLVASRSKLKAEFFCKKNVMNYQVFCIELRTYLVKNVISKNKKEKLSVYHFDMVFQPH